MTIPEQAGKVATSAIDALRGSPGLLSVVLLNVAILAMLYFAVSARNQQVHEQTLEMLERCMPTSTGPR